MLDRLEQDAEAASQYVLCRALLGRTVPAADRALRRAAVLMTLVASAKLRGANPEAYLADVLVRIATTPTSRADELTPRGWMRAHAAR